VSSLFTELLTATQLSISTRRTDYQLEYQSVSSMLPNYVAKNVTQEEEGLLYFRK